MIVSNVDCIEPFLFIVFGIVHLLNIFFDEKKIKETSRPLGKLGPWSSNYVTVPILNPAEVLVCECLLSGEPSEGLECVS